MTLTTINRHDLNDNPAGGYVVAVADPSTLATHVEMAEYDATRRTSPSIYIRWQDGPLGQVGTPEREAPNGAFVEDVITAALQRIQWYQQPGDGMLEGKFACVENAEVIEHLQAALRVLHARAARRTNQGVEGTNQGQ